MNDLNKMAQFMKGLNGYIWSVAIFAILLTIISGLAAYVTKEIGFAIFGVFFLGIFFGLMTVRLRNLTIFKL